MLCTIPESQEPRGKTQECNYDQKGEKSNVLSVQSWEIYFNQGSSGNWGRHVEAMPDVNNL
jgi:hypothetical protein